MEEPRSIRRNFRVLPIIDNWVEFYAEIRQALALQGLRIGEFDILIAVTARQHGLTTVTHNTKHFSKIQGLKCVDWVET